LIDDKSIQCEIDSIDERLINHIQNNFPVVRRPFEEIGKALDKTENEIIQRLNNLILKKYIKFIGTVIDTKMIGFKSQLVAFRVKNENISEAVKIINSYPGVSHNYLRDAFYNIWFTIACPADFNLLETVQKLAFLSKAEGFIELPSLKTYKVGLILKVTKKDNPDLERTNRISQRQGQIHKMNDFEKGLLNILQYSLPVTENPFDFVGKKIGVSQDAVIDAINNLKNKGVIKRTGAIVSHNKIGYLYNSLVLWEAPVEKLDLYGEYISAFNVVSHCYSRKIYPDWKYSLYSMIHSSNKDKIVNIIADTIEKIGKINFILLDSLKEFKKERLVYFTDEYYKWNNIFLA
jgi:siroheme decarboxylase